MKARENTLIKKPCFFCGEPSVFLFKLGARSKAVDCCVDCGERPAKRNRIITERAAKDEASS